jgi:serine protease Do
VNWRALRGTVWCVGALAAHAEAGAPRMAMTATELARVGAHASVVTNAAAALRLPQDPPPSTTPGAAPSPAQDLQAPAAPSPVTQLERTIALRQPSVVKVFGASGLQTIRPYCTGVVVSAQGHILTLDQILLQPERTRVVLHDGSVHHATLLPPEPQLGVRLIQIDAAKVEGGLQPLWPERERLDRTGRFVVALGNCFRLAEFEEANSATFGVVVGRANTALRHRLADVAYDGDLILTDAAINPGQEGGGLFALDGRWLGLNMKSLAAKETNTLLSAAIPVADLLPYLERVVRGQQAPEPVAVAREPAWLGVVLFDKAGRQSPPAYVERVVAGSPAAALGLRADDLIVRLDDFSIRTCREYRDVLARFAAGATVQLVWKRGQQVQQAEVTLAKEPAK